MIPPDGVMTVLVRECDGPEGSRAFQPPVQVNLDMGTPRHGAASHAAATVAVSGQVACFLA